MPDILQHLAENIAQIFQHRFGPRRVGTHQGNGTVERIEQEMRTDAGLQFCQLRLHIAGRDTPLFTNGALSLIASATRGIPRSINILCDMALVYGFGGGASMIDAALVGEVLADRHDFGVLSGPSATADITAPPDR